MSSESGAVTGVGSEPVSRAGPDPAAAESDPAAAGIDTVAALEDLKGLLGSRATDSVAIREHHSHGESYHTPAPPDIVCFPKTTEEVASILKISQAYRLPVVPFGAGTSLEG